MRTTYEEPSIRNWTAGNCNFIYQQSEQKSWLFEKKNSPINDPGAEEKKIYQTYNAILNGSDDGVYHSGLQGFWTLSIV
jgi:hypothetical protein